VTSTGKGRRGALIPAAAAAALAIAGTALVFGPSSGSPSPAPDSPASQSLAQPPAPTPTLSPTPAGGQPATSEPAPSAPALGAEAAGEPAPTYPPGQEPWLPVLTGFATDFTQPAPDWSTRVLRWTSDYLSEQYRQLPLDRVPAAALQDLQVVVSGEAVVDAIAVYDSGLRLAIRAENSAEGWKVAKVEPTE
jgi:hypothetical protein